MRLERYLSVQAVQGAGHRGALRGLALVLCLALLGIGRASAMETLQVRATVEAAMPAQGAPMLSDRMPCALCYVAPAPNANAFSSEGKEAESPTWWVHAPPAAATVRILAIAHRRDRVPIRISFCRWLD